MDSKRQLQKLIENLKTKQFREGEAKGLIESIQQEQTKALQPVLENITKEISSSVQKAVNESLKGIKIDSPSVDIPEIKVDVSGIEEAIRNIVINVPETKIPNISIPAPIVNIPETKIDIPDTVFAQTELANIDSKRPLPVRIYDKDGQPFQFPVSIGQGSGKIDFFTIKGFEQSAFSELLNPDGRLKVELPSGTSGLTDTELRASAVPVSQVSGSSWSVQVKEIFGSTITALLNGDNRIPVSVETGGSGLTDTELRASSVPVSQASGANWSVSVIDVFGSTGANVINPDGRVKVELPTGSSGLTDTELRASSVPVEQVSGSSWSTNVVGFTATVSAYLIDGDGNYRGTVPVSANDLDIRDLSPAQDGIRAYQVSGESYSTNVINASIAVVNLDRDGNPRQAWTVSDITASVKAALVDSGGVQYSGSNPLPIDLINIGDVAISTGNGTVGTGVQRVVIASNTTTAVVGTVASDTADDGSPPVLSGGIARTANPTAVAAGDRVSFTADDLGRQVVRPIQVRDLIKTAYVSITNGTEATLLAATAGSFNDLIMIVGSNNSDAAVSVDIRAVTAGNIINTLRIPANGTAGWTPPIAWPQDATGNNWTVDGPDETGRTLTFSALFSTEV